jgi:hypothetical protein
VVVLINFTPIQNYLAHRAADMLSNKLKTKVTVAHLRIDFLNHILLQGLYIEDQSHDTLLYAGEAQVRISDWFIFRDKPVLQYLGLQNAYAHLFRPSTSRSWNYDFIADAFSTGKKDTGKSKPFEFNLEKVILVNDRFHMDDQWRGEDMDFDVGNLEVNARKLDIPRKILDISTITGKNTSISVNDYQGGRPDSLRPPPTVDTTPFNPGKWAVQVKNLSLDGFVFRLTSNDKVPVANLFDETHLIVKNIQLHANAISVTGDTIHGNIENLACLERCGLTIKKMHSKVTVSPNASICENLYLETGYSKLQNYYAMHYRRFPAFNDYLDSVYMEAHFKDAVIDNRDIAYFAPELRKLQTTSAHLSGDGRGTVRNLVAQHLVVTDGITTIKGNLAMKGLPNIYKTYINYTDGEISTSATGIFRYAPGLRNNPAVALDKITFAKFRGEYEGYIENFFVNGEFTTNLGNATAHIKMDVPEFNGNTAVYSGNLAASNLQIGTLFRQPLLGSITLKEDISGSSFNADRAQMKIDGTISEFGINGYVYHNIITRGTLAKKQFDGVLQVDDPNLALEFDGSIDYSQKNINLKAIAHLLNVNFKAINLTTDNITASADFDLNCTGSNIDNFSGYAKLFNIDLKRNAHRLAIDSIYLSSKGSDKHRVLNIQSNNVVATIKGDYQLSKIPASVQYYLSRYIPNYIKEPSKFAPDQNFEFTVNTTSIDSIFAVSLQGIRGFDSSSFSGSLNTSAKKLTLNAEVPYGSIGKVHMSGINVTGIGSLDGIVVNTNIENMAIGDSVMNGSLSLTASVSNDSVAFTVATTSPDTSTAITLNGQVIARKDSLFLTVLPSQFYLNQVKWDIGGGSKIVYSHKYLQVQGFAITSGLQKITANSQLQNNDQSLFINTENLDLGQLGSWAGLASYQPEGRVNGSIRLDKIFGDLYVSANMKATGVKLGTDTIGTITAIGNYNGARKLISLDPQTGIYRDNASVIASGNISFDSNTNQKLDGLIQFNNTPISWATPFVAGVMSHLSGTLNGSVNFNGTSYNPLINGSVSLHNAGLRVDYTGCNYTIPSANIHIDNRRIDFGKVMLYDAFLNPATLSGYFSHNLFKDVRMRLTMATKKFEVVNLASYENNMFYGNLIASIDSFNIRGPFNNVRLSVHNAVPAAKSRIYIPISNGTEGATYNYVSFKTYGTNQEKQVKRIQNKIHITIDANFNTLAEMHIVLDPSTGDEIMARGEGNIQMDIPPNNDVHIIGLYTIESGLYTFTFRQAPISRQFKLNQGSSISFNGPFSETNLDVNAVYSTKARLSDLLTDAEKTALTQADLTDAQAPQWVDIILHMTGSLYSPKLTFDLDLQDKHSQGSIAYRKLQLLNYDDKAKTYQVGALLFANQFYPSDGAGTGTLGSGVVNNISQIISSSASAGLTSLINKITGDKQLNVDVKYNNYSTLGTSNMSQVYVSGSHNFFNDRLIVELGSTSDWGRPSSSSTSSNFNITGNARVQYLLTKKGSLRLNTFHISDYDVTLDKDIQRSGVGISWRKSFDNLDDFFRGNKYTQKKIQEQLDKEQKNNNSSPADTAAKNGGTD